MHTRHSYQDLRHCVADHDIVRDHGCNEVKTFYTSRSRRNEERRQTRDELRTYERIDELQRRENVEPGATETRTHQALVAHLAANMPAPHHENQRVVG